MPSLFHGFGTHVSTRITLDDQDFENDSMFQDSEESLLSYSPIEAFADSPRRAQFPISAERSTLYDPHRVFTPYHVAYAQDGEVNTDSSEFPTSQESMKSSSSSTMDLVVSSEGHDHSKRARIRITARRFYERLKHFHLNRNYQSVAFDNLRDAEIDQIFAETDSPPPDYSSSGEMICPNADLGNRFSFTMGEAPDDFSIISVGGHLQRAIPIRRDTSDEVGHNLRLGTSFKYFKSLLRRSASLRDPPPTFGDEFPTTHVYQDWSDNEDASSQQAEMGSNMTLQTPMDETHSPPPPLSPQPHGDNDIEVQLENSPVSGNEMLKSKSEENSSMGISSSSDKSLSYISPMNYMIDDLLMTRDMVSSAFYFSG